ncbi:MAG TPA: hypothetical protein VMH84_09485 [Xanthobacteraceae bacterium]|nr:hypothetical protein [Xanthobacteraceae bacterium]
MDTLHTVLRTIRGETKSRRDHLTVFREFLSHLDRIGRRSPRPPRDTKVKAGKPNGRTK